MLGIRKIGKFKKGIVFKNGDVSRLIKTGWYLGMPFSKESIRIYSEKEAFINDPQIDEVVKSGILQGVAETFSVKEYERLFVWINGTFTAALGKGCYAFWKEFQNVRTELCSEKDVFLRCEDRDIIFKSGQLGSDVEMLELKDAQRALVFVDGRLQAILDSGRHYIWKTYREVVIRAVNAAEGLVQVPELGRLAINEATASGRIQKLQVEEGCEGLFYLNGAFVSRLMPGVYFFWKDGVKIATPVKSCREQIVTISGQDIMTADKVTLRINADVTYRITDLRKAFESVENVDQTLYREAQLALRAVVGTREIDVLLKEKDGVSEETRRILSEKLAVSGIEITGAGIRDIILPGEMKDILNRVIEAKKAAEANLITRREETAAMRSQLNTAKMLEDNPVLMRMKELEIVQKIVENTKLSVLLGEKGLRDQIVNLL